MTLFRRSGGLALLALLCAAPPAAGQEDPPLPTLPRSAEIQLKLQRDGALSVTEAISVPRAGTMVREVPLRMSAQGNRDRFLGVRDVSIEGQGTAELTGERFTVRLHDGTSVLRYTVDGAVAELDGGGLAVSWPLASGWDTGLELVRAAFAAPEIPVSVRCLAAGLPCRAAQIDHAGLTRFSQQNVLPGGRMEMTVELAPGTVPANERLRPAATLAGAYVLTEPVRWGWAGLAVLTAGSGALLWRSRRRDRLEVDPLPIEMVDQDGRFAPPQGVLPGHTGTLLGGRADQVDVAATVLDLAVRGHIGVSEIPAETPAEVPDWRLTRHGADDGGLSAAERRILAALFPGGTGAVTLTGLRAAGADVPAACAALRDAAVARGWSRRRGRLVRAGVRIACYGIFLTALLTLTVGYAQLGPILVLAGLALALGGRWLPPRTRRGRELTRRLRGLSGHLRVARVDRVPEAERGPVFSRVLPYALALGEHHSWLRAFGGPDHPPEVGWYTGDATGHGVLAGIEEFLAGLVGTLTGAGHVRRREP
jgi:hypothetical protein